jgi:basic amino acid/polyamine antiporter, APA family
MLQLFAFGFGTIVGIAWVVLMGQLLAQGGLLGVFLGLTCGALMIMLIALCYVRVGTRLPLVGGEVAYARELYGETASNVLGWFLLLSCILVCCFEMVSVGWIIAQLWPALARTRLYTVLNNDVCLEPLVFSVAVQALIAGANHVGAKGAGRLQTVAAGGKIALSCAFIVAGLRIAQPRFAQPLFVADASGSLIPGIVSVITVAPFWFSGFNAIAQTLGERAGNVSAAKAAGMIVISLAAAWAFYCLVLLSMALVMPRAQLLSYSLPTAAAFQTAFNSARLGNMVLLAGLLGLISTWNALFFSATRILLVLAQSGFVSARFQRLHPRFTTPTAAIVLLGTLIPLGALLGKGVIGALLSAFDIVMAGIYATVCLGAIRLQRADAQQKRWSVRGLLPPVALASCAAIALLASLEPLAAWRNGRLPIEWLLLLAWGLCGAWLMRQAHARVTAHRPS